jgi:2-isopropylmalate synthase
LDEAGFEPTDDEVREITRRVKDHGAEKNRVTKSDVERFAREIGVTRHEEVRA